MRQGHGLDDARVILDLVVILGGAALCLAAGTMTLRRTEA
jgi:hypothetical protein